VTWVIAMPGLPTRGVLLGDVRVTLRFGNGAIEEREGVRKIHAVAPNIAIGFAGGVDIGLKMVGDFKAYIARSVPPGYMTYEPSRAFMKWSRRIRHHWEATVPESDKQGGCQLVVVAALPSTGPFTKTVAYVLEEPDFELQPIPAMTAVSIGSGSMVGEYRSALEGLANDHELFQFETMYWDHIGGAGMAVSMAIDDAINARPVRGISPHLHICSVRWGAIEIGTNDRHALTPGVPSRVMPPVAESWKEWLEWKNANGLAEAGSFAVAA
jgi:hypothetical protein